jgi:hypothetical protein
MKKHILLFIISAAVPFLSLACDICGCGIGNTYIGILPDFNKHILGVRYRQNAMMTHVGIGGSTSYLTTKETYRIAELWGGWNITRNFRLMLTLPYSFNEKINQGISKTKNGPGDVTLTGYYQLLNTKKVIAGSKLLVQNLWAGGGVKLATGKYNPSDKSSGNDNANLFQSGTGSYDFTLNVMYDIRLQDVGLNINSVYKINTKNRYDYRYGNKFNISSQVYYKFRVKKKVTIAPNAGIQYEISNRDIDKNMEVTVSGGRLFSGTAGIEVSFGKISFGANMQTPLSQNLANGIVQAKDRAMLHVSFIL